MKAIITKIFFLVGVLIIAVGVGINKLQRAYFAFNRRAQKLLLSYHSQIISTKANAYEEDLNISTTKLSNYK